MVPGHRPCGLAWNGGRHGGDGDACDRGDPRLRYAPAAARRIHPFRPIPPRPVPLRYIPRRRTLLRSARPHAVAARRASETPAWVAEFRGAAELRGAAGFRGAEIRDVAALRGVERLALAFPRALFPVGWPVATSRQQASAGPVFWPPAARQAAGVVLVPRAFSPRSRGPLRERRPPIAMPASSNGRDYS